MTGNQSEKPGKLQQSARIVCCIALLMAAHMLLEAQTASLDQAWAAAANGDRGKALTITRELAKREPGNADVRLLLGSLLAEEGEKREAIEQLTVAVHLRPDSAEAWNALGEAYNSFGDGKAAREPFERAVKLNPKFGVAEANLGAVLLQTGESAAAAGHLDRAIQLLGRSPDAADTHYLRAKICTTAGQTDEAAMHLEQAVKLRPNFAEAWSDLGEVYRTKLNPAEALTAFERAVKLNPNDAVAQYRLGAEYLRRSQTALALDHLQTAYKLDPTDQSTLNALQTALRQAGRSEDAARIKSELAAALRKRDQKSQANLNALKLNNQGADLERAGNLPAAVEKYRQALDLQPDHNGIRVNFATALLRLGRWSEGLTELHEASQREPDNRDIQIALKDALSQAPRALLPDWAKAQPVR